jgi:hypothetical protein
MLSLDKFSELLLASGLMSKEKLAAEKAGFSSNSGEEFATYLVGRNILTRWQVEHLLQGKYKGFFLDEYKLLELVGPGKASLRYRAVNTQTGELVILHVGLGKFIPLHNGKHQYVVERLTG